MPPSLLHSVPEDHVARFVSDRVDTLVSLPSNPSGEVLTDSLPP